MSDRHEHLDEGIIHAWLDGALSPDESTRIESLAAVCDECGARVAEARGLIAASSRILSSLDAGPGGVIPGINAGNDQLAALRARRQAGSRRWWLDRRVVVAASLVLVAGVSRVVWQSSNSRVVETPSALVDAVKSTEPAAVADAPTIQPAPAPGAAGAGVRDTKTTPPESRATPRRIAVTADSTASLRAAGATPSLARGAADAANERRRVDSLVVTGATGTSLSRPDSAVVAGSPATRLASQGRRQALGGSTRQGQPVFRRDSATQPSAPPASFGERLKLSPVVPTGVPAARANAVAVSCYLLRLPTGADTVRLLNQQVPVLSDPAWFRAVASGALRDSTLAWRSIDSLTVELRRDNGSDSSAMRFGVSGAAPDVRGLSGVRALASSRVECP